MQESDREIDLDRVASYLKRADTFAVVEQTGGGTATLFAGAQSPGCSGLDCDQEHRAAAAGPGWFAGDAWTRPRADLREFSIASDDHDPVVCVDCSDVLGEDAEATVAQRILEVVQLQTQL